MSSEAPTRSVGYSDDEGGLGPGKPPVLHPVSPCAPTHIQDQLQSTWRQVGADVAEHTPGHLAHQVAGLGQESQQDLHQHLHPRRLLGGCRWERLRLESVLGPGCAPPSRPGGSDPPVALERVRRGFSTRLFLMQV